MKYKYKLKNLDCAQCAKRVEEYLSSQQNFNNVVVNFSTLNLSFNTLDSNIDKKYVQKLVSNVEPEVVVLDENESYAHSSDYKYTILRIFLSFILMLCTLIVNQKMLCTFFFLISYILMLYKPIIDSIKLLKRHIIDENILVSISCIGAFIIGERYEGLMVIFLYEIGKLLESLALNKSRNSITSLITIKQDYATMENGDEVPVEKVRIDDIILVKPGQSIPVDGTIIEGNTNLDTSVITGESKLVSVSTGDIVLSGSISTDGLIKIKVLKEYENSTISRIMELVTSATDKKTQTETFVNKLSKIYTPIIILLAILVGILLPIFTDISFKSSIYKALSFLVISCPCAIVISVPLSYFSAIGTCSKQGILIKGSNYLDNLLDIKEIVFDKTGTLTTGKFSVTDVKVFSGTKEEILYYAVLAENMSTHPIAQSIVKYYGKKIDNKSVVDYKEQGGYGITYKIDDKNIKVGNSKLVKYDENIDGSTNIFVSVNDNVIGCIVLTDMLNETSKLGIKLLNDKGIKTSMLTGDNELSTVKVANELNISDYKYCMLPEDKYNEIISKQKKTKVAFVGDGINDAPVLAASDIGISMGLNGANIAIETSDIVIMTNDLTKISKVIDISRFTNNIIKINITFALFIKILVLILTFIGIGSMWQAIFADVGVTLITIFNSFRILSKK